MESKITPVISVIVPVYNTEQYLIKCFDSLVNQTFQDIEIVVINDGSTDNSSEIIQDFSKRYPSLFLVLEQKNSGQAVARNRGIAACHGAYIAFLDSDDYLELNALEIMYHEITSNNADMAYGNFWLEIDGVREKKCVKHHKNQRDLFIDCQVDPWNKMYKAEILKNHGVSFPEGYFYEDTAWFIETIPWIRKAVKVEEPVFVHLERKGSSMTALDDNRVSHIFPVMNTMLSYYMEHGLYEKYRDELEFFYTKILLCSSIIRIGRISKIKIMHTLVNRTFAYVRGNFPEYKKNKYWKAHKLNVYIQFLAPWNAAIVLCATKILRKIRKREALYGVCSSDSDNTL